MYSTSQAPHGAVILWIYNIMIEAGEEHLSD